MSQSGVIVEKIERESHDQFTFSCSLGSERFEVVAKVDREAVKDICLPKNVLPFVASPPEELVNKLIESKLPEIDREEILSDMEYDLDNALSQAQEGKIGSRRKFVPVVFVEGA